MWRPRGLERRWCSGPWGHQHLVGRRGVQREEGRLGSLVDTVRSPGKAVVTDSEDEHSSGVRVDDSDGGATKFRRRGGVHWVEHAMAKPTMWMKATKHLRQSQKCDNSAQISTRRNVKSDKRRGRERIHNG